MNSVPACVFTYPEIAFVGQLSSRRSGAFPLAASAKASCLGESRGFVKVFEEAAIIVGVLIIAPHAGEDDSRSSSCGQIETENARCI